MQVYDPIDIQTLNRQGVPHENHEFIKDKPVKNPCNNPGCTLNRIVMSHESHDCKITNATQHRDPNEESPYDASTDGSEYVEPDKNMGDRIMWTCSICKQKFSEKSAYLSHGCHFR